MPFQIPDDLNRDLMPLAWMIGHWEGRDTETLQTRVSSVSGARSTSLTMVGTTCTTSAKRSP